MRNRMLRFLGCARNDNILLGALLLFAMTFAFAQPVIAEDNLEQRITLAEKMLELRPAREQVSRAIDTYIRTYMIAEPPKTQEAFRIAMLSVMNIKALEKLTIDAYAETYTQEELAAMVAYYSQPEARSASDKQEQFARRLTPEIVKMLDQAAMRIKTGAAAP